MTPVCLQMTRTVWSTASMSAYHNTVPVNSTPKTRQSSARLSFGRHSATRHTSVHMFQHCSPCSSVSPLSILFPDLAFIFLFILCTYAPPLPHPISRSFIPAIRPSSFVRHYTVLPGEVFFSSIVLWRPCFSFRARVRRSCSFPTPHTLLVDTLKNVTYTTPCTVRSLLLQIRY